MTPADNFAKVRRAVIEPMVRYYQLKPLDDYQIQAFVEDLGDYSESSLDLAWREVRKLCRARPSIAHFIEALKDQVKPGTALSNPVDRNEYRCHYDSRLADEMLRSEIGQLALTHGMGYSVWIFAYRDGKRITREELRKEMLAMKDTASRIAAYRDERNASEMSCLKLWEAFQEREKRLYQKYANAA